MTDRRVSPITPLIFCLALLVGGIGWPGCAPHPKGMEPAAVSPSPTAISAIEPELSREAATVKIFGNRPLTYTSVKQPRPLAVILYFPETTISGLAPVKVPENPSIAAITVNEIDKTAHTSRVEIQLKQDLDYHVSREANTLTISFNPSPPPLAQAAGSGSGLAPKATDQKPAPMPQAGQPIQAALASGASVPNATSQTDEVAKPALSGITAEAIDHLPLATKLEGITYTRLKSGLSIHIQANGTIRHFKSFTIDKPPRIVFDLAKVASSLTKEGKLVIDSPWAKQVRHFGYPDRLRVVIDTNTPMLSAYRAEPVPDGLVVMLGRPGALRAGHGKIAAPVRAPGSVNLATRSKKGPNWVNRVDFSSENNGKSTIIIGTTAPVKYRLDKTGTNRLELDLIDARLPEYRQRPLITTRFDSAVDRILPIQTPAMKDRAEIRIEMRQAVPYFVEQVDNLLMLHFDASTVAARPLKEAQLPPWQQALMQPAKAAPSSKNQAPKAISEIQKKDDTQGQTQKFTGEKIALDFFDTDIRNVFRILQEVSGKNFAIDKDVTGKVTLSLDKPVPWDQVLDLILRMNQLGMTEDGTIIRIATQRTLRAEKDQRLADKAAQQKIAEQNKALEPLVTQYMAINYANATKDILPNLQKILTKGRGSISVDERTNQIIMTDTADKIQQAQEIIKKLDKVTPQVLIEARIVQASTTFSREIGTNWSVAGGIANTATNAGIGPQPGMGALGGTYGYNMALNLPVAASNPATIGFNFMRITGSPLQLDAQLMVMDSMGEGKIVSTPRIVTLDNKKAVIKQGLKYPYNKLDYSGNTTTAFEDIDLTLEVTPHVTADNRIDLQLHITKNDIGAVINNQQSFTTKEAQTELLVNHGDTVVIGGIIQNTKNNDQSGVPGLSDLPVLGWLFKTHSVSTDKEELLIFITPQIVKLDKPLSD